MLAMKKIKQLSRFKKERNMVVGKKVRVREKSALGG
jgi:hypothetical protein